LEKVRARTWHQPVHIGQDTLVRPRKGKQMKVSLQRNGRTTSGLLVFCLIAVTLVWFGAAGSAAAHSKSMLEKFWADDYGNNALLSFDGNGVYGFEKKLLAKARPDECFQGVGNPLNLNDPWLGFYANYPGDLGKEQIRACLDTEINDYQTPNGHAQPKTNQAYVWGLTKYSENLWFGTIPNTHCLVITGFLGIGASSMNSSWVCEGLNEVTDFRPPRAFFYNLKKKKLVEVTKKILAREPDASYLKTTIGLRSAGSAGGVAFLGGISAILSDGEGGVNIFAFDAKTGKYLGVQSYPEYTNIRQWRLVRGELYVGVAKRDGGGVILRWIGKKSTCLKELFRFETVGVIGGDPAYITEHDGRIFASTWPAGANLAAEPMSIYMSPWIGKDGKLHQRDAQKWKRVWTLAEYEPEASVVYSTGGGALMSYKGNLYWGTMHVPGLSLLVWRQMHPNASEEDLQAALLGTYRPISIFRGKNFGSKHQEVELLYGNCNLPQYVSNEVNNAAGANNADQVDGVSAGWQIVPNNMGQAPKYGLAGFNNFLNNYTWWMEVYKDQLFVGTMDFSYLIGAELGDLLDFPKEVVEIARKFFGADLWRFTSSNRPAVPVSLNGVGNYTNYGVRTMVSDDALYVGTANPMNLMTDPKDDRPEGGWELLKLYEPHKPDDRSRGKETRGRDGNF